MGDESDEEQFDPVSSESSASTVVISFSFQRTLLIDGDDQKLHLFIKGIMTNSK